MAITCSVLEDLKYSGNGCDEEYNNQMVKEINSDIYTYMIYIHIWYIYISYHNMTSWNKN